MIYEWGRSCIELFKELRHWFRALTCRNVYYYHGVRMCREEGKESDSLPRCACDYRWCPKRKAEVE